MTRWLILFLLIAPGVYAGDNSPSDETELFEITECIEGMTAEEDLPPALPTEADLLNRFERPALEVAHALNRFVEKYDKIPGAEVPRIESTETDRLEAGVDFALESGRLASGIKRYSTHAAFKRTISPRVRELLEARFYAWLAPQINQFVSSHGKRRFPDDTGAIPEEFALGKALREHRRSVVLYNMLISPAQALWRKKFGDPRDPTPDRF